MESRSRFVQLAFTFSFDFFQDLTCVGFYSLSMLFMCSVLFVRSTFKLPHLDCKYLNGFNRICPEFLVELYFHRIDGGVVFII